MLFGLGNWLCQTQRGARPCLPSGLVQVQDMAEASSFWTALFGHSRVELPMQHLLGARALMIWLQ